jgi:type IV secretion system protein TrbE
LGPAALAFVASSRPEDHALIDRVTQECGESFAAAWLNARGQGAAADAIHRFNNQSQQVSPALLAAE